MVRGKYNVKKLGKYIEEVVQSDEEKGYELVGRAFISALSRIDIGKVNTERDRDYVGAITQVFGELVENKKGIYYDIDEGIKKSGSIVRRLKGIPNYGRISLVKGIIETSGDLGYREIGRGLYRASRSLTEKVNAVRDGKEGIAPHEMAVIVLKNYLHIN